MNHSQQATENTRPDDVTALTEFLASLMDYTPSYGVNVKHRDYFADSPSTGMDPASGDE